MSRLYARTLQPIDRLVYRATKQQTTFTAVLTGLPVVHLTTIGAKSGQPRTLPLVAIPKEDGLIVIASNYGQRRHPAWYHNLKANPRATAKFEGATREMIAHELEGAERERWYQRGIEIYPGWVQYRERTAAHRQIGVFELRPVGLPCADLTGPGRAVRT
jgi:deazaflavin-dependent oxidoreductase (nitroreductase family)